MSKRTIILSILVLAANALMAQETSESPAMDHFYFDLYHEDWLHLPEGIKVDWPSHGIDVGLMYDHVMAKHISVGIGAGFSSSNVFFNGLPTTVEDTSAGTSSAELVRLDSLYGEGYGYKTNKLSMNYLDIPVALRFRSRPNRFGYRWKGSVGMRFGYHIDTHSKTIDDNGKSKLYNYDHMRKWKIVATARFGYGKGWVSAYYGLNSIFDDASYSIIPWAVGLGFTL